MAKDKSVEDIISEEEYTVRMSSASTSPEDDSPGDSETDAATETLMGMNYERDDMADSEDDDEPSKEKVQRPRDIPETAAIVSSNRPSPWMDRDATSDTH